MLLNIVLFLPFSTKTTIKLKLFQIKSVFIIEMTANSNFSAFKDKKSLFIGELIFLKKNILWNDIKRSKDSIVLNLWPFTAFKDRFHSWSRVSFRLHRSVLLHLHLRGVAMVTRSCDVLSADLSGVPAAARHGNQVGWCMKTCKSRGGGGRGGVPGLTSVGTQAPFVSTHDALLEQV